MRTTRHAFVGLIVLGLGSDLGVDAGMGGAALGQSDGGSPAPARGLRVRADGAFEGCTLFAPIQSGSTYLIDMGGAVVHEWKTPYGPGASVYLLEDGNLLRCTRVDDNPRFWGGGIGGRILEIEPDGKVAWTFTFSDEEHCQHHDVKRLPNGNVLLIAWEYLSIEEALRRGRDADAVSPEGFWPDALFEVEPIRPAGGRIVWEWHSKDHLIQDRDPEKPDYGAIPGHPGRIDVNGDHRDTPALSEEELAKAAEREAELRALGYVGGNAPEENDAARSKPERRGDWLHTNAVDYHPGLDLVLLSVPHFDEVWILDHSTTSAEAATSAGGRHGRGGDLLWRWGHPRRHGAGSDADRRLFRQHDAQWIRPGLPGAGHLLLFNNGLGRPEPAHSTVDELVLPLDAQRRFVHAAGRPFGPAAPAWSYAAPVREEFYSFFISGCQRLQNGNTLICSGKQGRFFEVDAAGTIVWEYWNPYGGELPSSFGGAAPKTAPGAGPIRVIEPNSTFRCTRIASDHPGLVRLGLRGPAR